MKKITIKLDKSKTCACGIVHTGFVRGIAMNGYFWFNCSCKSTLLAPLGPQIRTLIDLCEESKNWVEKASGELGIVIRAQ